MSWLLVELPLIANLATSNLIFFAGLVLAWHCLISLRIS